jgi:hypothetical protein
LNNHPSFSEALFKSAGSELMFLLRSVTSPLTGA